MNSTGVAVLAKDKLKTYLTHCSMYSLWFERFMFGCHKRMGDIVLQDMALSIDVVVALDSMFDREYCSADDPERKHYVAVMGLWSTVGFVGGFRGEELPRADLFGCQKHFEDKAQERHPHFNFVLVGRFKGETGLRYHLLPLPATTRSGLKLLEWGRHVLEG